MFICMLEIYFQLFHVTKSTWIFDEIEGFYLHSQKKKCHHFHPKSSPALSLYNLCIDYLIFLEIVIWQPKDPGVQEYQHIKILCTVNVPFFALPRVFFCHRKLQHIVTVLENQSFDFG